MILHHIPPSQSNAACEVQWVTMDTNAGTFQTHLLGCPRVFAAPKANNVQLSGGLMRYHSAPSSVLTGLLDDDFYPDSEDSEFARLLNDGIGSFSSLLDTVAFQQAEKSQAVFTMDVNKEDPYLNHGRMNPQHSHFIGTGQSFQEHLIQSPLSAISEHAVEEPVDKCCCPLPGGSAQQAAQPSHQNQTDSSSCNSVLTSDPHFNNSLRQSESGLIRHSSSPAGFLSKLALEEVSEGPMMKLGGSWGKQHCAVRSKPEEKFGGESIFPSIPPALGSCFIEAKSTDKLNELSSPRRPNVLLRQSSSPAGLLSQVTLEEISMAREKMALSSSSGSSSVEGTFDKRRLVSMNCQAMGGWDDTTADLAMQHHAAFGQRKRGRGFDDKMLNDLVATNSLQRSPTDLSNSPVNNFTVPTNSPPQSFDSMEGSALDSVLCKARAKRGCATHPRSIAERVRRTKISERMKKLQDLVPNLDKQASTAEMLDEVVEYVQLLQRQVQELSLNRPLCNGICQQDRDSTL